MRKMMVRGAMAVMCVMGAAGCGDDNDSSGTTISSYPVEFSQVYCAKLYECCTAAEITEMNGLITFSSEEDCRTKYGALLVGFSPSQSDVDAGKVTFDAAKATASLSTARSASCTALFGEQDALDDVASGIYQGKVEDGGACSSNVMCAIAGSDCLDGKCKAPAKVGDTCDSFFDCDTDAEDLYCDADKKCAAKAASGAACDSDQVCLSGACFESKCIAPRATDEACDSGPDCTSRSCDFGTQKCEAPKADGEPCFNDGECMSGACAQVNGSFMCGPTSGPTCDGM
jgi:hypothetical protein